MATATHPLCDIHAYAETSQLLLEARARCGAADRPQPVATYRRVRGRAAVSAG